MPWDSTAVRDCHFSTLSIAYGCDPGWTLRLPASGTYIMMIISSRQIDAIHRRLATSWPSWRRHSELFAILHSIRKKAHVSILHWWFSRKEYWLLKPKLATLTVSHTFCGGASQVSSNTAACGYRADDGANIDITSTTSLEPMPLIDTCSPRSILSEHL